MEFSKRRFLEMALAVVLVGGASLSAREAEACGGGSNGEMALLGIGAVGVLGGTVAGFTGFTFLDLAAMGDGHGVNYGLGETLFGGAFTALFTGLAVASGQSGDNDVVALGCMAAWSGALTAHGIYTMANPRIDSVPIEVPSAEPAVSVAPLLLADRGKQAYGLNLAARF